MAKRCWNGHPMPEDARYCARCGAHAAPAEPDPDADADGSEGSA